MSEFETVREALDRVEELHPNHTKPRHQQKTRERIRSTDAGDPLYESYTQRIRLDPDGLAPALVCGGPRPQWQYGHPSEPRGLTVHERALLQTFGPDYTFKGGVVAGRVQTGNAVPPLLAEKIAEVIV